MRDKKAVIKIIEAFIGVLIVMTSVLIIISRQSNFDSTTGEEMMSLLKSILTQINQDNNLRDQVLNNNSIGVNELAEKNIPKDYNYTINICDIEKVCPLGFYIDKEVYAKETIIAANVTEYNPILVKIFCWKGPFPEGYEPRCGNTKCEAGENLTNCPADCSIISQPQQPPAIWVASYSNLRIDGGSAPTCVNATYNKWAYFDTEIQEVGGKTSVNITQRQKCYHSNEPRDWCDKIKSASTMFTSGTLIQPGELIERKDNYVCLTGGYTYSMNETFWGRDIYGNVKESSYIFSVTI